MELQTLKEVAKLCRHKLPEKHAANGQPKSEAMRSTAKLYKPENKAEVMAALQKLNAAGMICYRHDLRLVALTKLGLDVLGKGELAITPPETNE